MTMFKKACRKSWTLGVWSRRLDSGLLDLDSWTLDDQTLGLWTTGPLDFGRLDPWNLDSWTLDDRTLGLWPHRRLDYGRLYAWTLDHWSQEILSIFSNIYFFLIIS